MNKNSNTVGATNALTVARLKRLRLGRELTQEAVAEILGVTQQTYSKYEKEGNLDGANIVKLCNYYGVSADYLLGIDKLNRNTKNVTANRISDIEINMIVDKIIDKINN